MTDNQTVQGELHPGLAGPVKDVVLELLRTRHQPSAWELLKEIDTTF